MRTGEGWDTNAYTDRDASLHSRPRVLLDEMGTHFVDTFRFLLGEVTSVYARLQQRKSRTRGRGHGEPSMASWFRSTEAAGYNAGAVADRSGAVAESEVRWKPGAVPQL